MASFEERKGKKGTSWRAVIKRAGMKTLSATFDSHSEAKRWAAETEADISRGEISHVKAGKDMTLGAAIARYKAEATPKRKSAKSRRCEGYLLDLLAAWDWATISLAKLDRKHFREWRDYRRKEHNSSDATIKKDIKLIGTIYNYANIEWDIRGLVFDGHAVLKGLSSAKERDRRPTLLEWDKIVAHFTNILPQFSIFIQVLRLTAMRRDELLYLRRDQIDEHGYVYLYDTKNGENRSFGLPPKALELLYSLPVRASGRFFGFESSTAASNWSRNIKKLGIKDLRMHDLRHDAISHYVEMGLPIPMIQVISGHLSPNSMKRYINMRKETVYSEFMRLLNLRDDISGRYKAEVYDFPTINLNELPACRPQDVIEMENRGEHFEQVA